MASETSKIFRASKDATSGVQVTEDDAALVGNKQHFVLSNNTGNVIYGPTSIVADAANRRVGGLWTGINDFVHMFPSTIVTPIPQQIPNPILGSLTRLASDTAFFMAMLAAG